MSPLTGLAHPVVTALPVALILCGLVSTWANSLGQLAFMAAV
ncbi:MAG: hypothetical protein ACRDQV_09125 [Pseudonocardiaceae bacterium]